MGIFGIIWVFYNRVNTYYFRLNALNSLKKSESKREHSNKAKLKDYKPDEL